MSIVYSSIAMNGLPTWLYMFLAWACNIYAFRAIYEMFVAGYHFVAVVLFFFNLGWFIETIKTTKSYLNK